MATADRAQLIAELLLDDKFTKPLNRIDKRLGAFSGAVNRNLGRGIDHAVSAVARGVVNVGKSVATAAIDWEDAFQGVVKTVDATPAQFDEIAESIRGMAREMPIAATELAGIAEQGGAMGIKADDIAAFTKQVAILASTTNVSADDAAAALGALQTTIGLTGDEFDNFAAALVDLGNKGSSTEDVILEIANRAGSSASLFGIAKDSVLGWSAAVANLKVKPELGGTALQNIFLKLMPKIKEGSKTLRTVMGRSGKDIQKLFKRDAGRALELFVRKLAKLPADARLDAVQKIFGKGSGITRVLLGLTNDVGMLSDSLDEGSKAWKEATAAQIEFDKRNQTVRSAITRLKNNLFDAAITIGEGFVPALGRAADKISEFLKVPTNRQALKDLGADIGRIIDKVDWDGLLDDARSFMRALEKAGGFAASLWDAFSAIPSDAKAVLLSLAGLEKLTGGAVSGIVGDIGKGLFEQFASRGSSPANPVWVAQVGKPGSGKDVPDGGPGGKGGKPTKPTKPGSARDIIEQERSGGRLKDIAKGGLVIVATAVAVRGDTVTGAPGGAMADKTLLADLRRMLAQGRGGEGVGGGRTVVQAIDALTKKLGISTAGTDPSDPHFENRNRANQIAKAIDLSRTDTIAEQIGTRRAVEAEQAAVVSSQGQMKSAVTASVTNGASQTANAATGAGSRVTGQSIGNTGRIVGAIQAIPAPQTFVDVDVSISAGQVRTSETTRTRSSTSSSRTDDDWSGHGKG